MIITKLDQDVLKLLALGYTAKAICKHLSIHVYAYNWHMKVLRDKLNATNGAHAVAIALANGIIQNPAHKVYWKVPA